MVTTRYYHAPVYLTTFSTNCVFVINFVLSVEFSVHLTKDLMPEMYCFMMSTEELRVC